MNNQSFRYQVFTPLGLQDIWIRKFEFVAKTQFLCSDAAPEELLKHSS